MIVIFNFTTIPPPLQHIKEPKDSHNKKNKCGKYYCFQLQFFLGGWGGGEEKDLTWLNPKVTTKQTLRLVIGHFHEMSLSGFEAGFKVCTILIRLVNSLPFC